MEEKGKYVINLEKGTNQAVVTILEGQAPKRLDEKAPIEIDYEGCIGAPFEFLSKRIDCFSLDYAALIVDREAIEVRLIINEEDPYKRGTVSGKLEFYPKFIEFGINTGKIWDPAKLGLFMKMNRSFFPDKDLNRKLVSELMNFCATVNQSVNKGISQKGDVSDNFSQVVNSNLPEAFTLKISVFKGMPEELIEVETFAQIDGREVAFTLISPGANQTMEDLRNKVIDEQIQKFRELAPSLVIIEQ